MSATAWIVFGVFLAYVIWDGVRRSARASDLDEYYAGGRKIPWWAAGLSIMATQASAITVIGTTGQGHDGGLSFVQFYFGLPFAMVLLCLFFVPVYRRLPILTVYEYLEGRFNRPTRALASLVFLASRCLALGIVITAPAVVMSAMLELPLETTIVVVGVLTTGYTVFGGVSAVVWTDVKQMAVILGGIVLCFVWLAIDVFSEIGLEGALRAAGAAGKLNAFELVPPSTDLMPRLVGDESGQRSFWEHKYTFWTGLIGGLFLQLSYFGCDQSQVQRILTNPSANDSRKALLLSAFAKVPMQLLVLAIGVLLWLSHGLQGEPILYRPDDRARAEASEDREAFASLEARFEAAQAARREALLAIAEAGDEASQELTARYQNTVDEALAVRTEAASTYGARGKREDTNFVFPQWILATLPGPLLGLIVAAIFAAAMSSVDSVLNSLSAATVVDFYLPYLRPRASQRESVRAGRITTMLWGVVATWTALVMISGSSIIEQVNRVGSYFYGSLLGVFVLGLFFPRVRGWAGFFGLCGGMVSVLIVDATLRVEYLWYNVVGVVGVLVTALPFALWGRRSSVSGPSSPAQPG
ncbi:MAG: sodium:solute symporter family transporter [Planctomycetota bacterium]